MDDTFYNMAFQQLVYDLKSVLVSPSDRIVFQDGTILWYSAFYTKS